MNLSKKDYKRTIKGLIKKGFIKKNEVTGDYNLTPKGIEEMEKRDLI